jgi:hypothetical protein
MHASFLVGKIPRKRPKRRCEDAIEIHLREAGGIVWLGLILPRAETSGGFLPTR